LSIHTNPVRGDFAVQILVTDSRAFQLRPERFRTPGRYVVFDRLIDEAAALARSGHPVNGLDRGLRQNNIDAFAHGNESR
jgi:hypothetical protein